MSVQAKITSKGQITLPLRVRNELGVRPGDKIAFERNDEDEITIRPVRGESPFAKYRGSGNPGIATGAKSINKHVREIRGFDPDDTELE